MSKTRKTSVLTLGLAGVLASALLTGCTPDGEVLDADYAQVCQDKTTQQRIDDDKCSEEGRSSGHYGWYFYNMGGTGSTTRPVIPSVGSPLSGGETSIPPGASVKGGTPSKGSTVSRGGFGGSAKGGGSTGG